MGQASHELKWFCEECDEDFSLIVEHDPHASVGGFYIKGLHLHMSGETVELPAIYVTVDSMVAFKDFAEVMRRVRADVEDNE